MFYVRLLVLLVLAGCATKKPSEYQLWVSEPTPQVFQDHSMWRFFLLNQDGSIIRNIVVQFSDEPAQTCSSGNFQKLKVISEYPKRSELYLGEPAYEIRGAALIVDLSANLCSAGYELRGKVSNLGIEGYHQPVSKFGGEVAGRFYGMPLEKK